MLLSTVMGGGSVQQEDQGFISSEPRHFVATTVLWWFCQMQLDKKGYVV